MLKVRMPMSVSSAMAIAQRGTHKHEDGVVFSHDTRLHGTSIIRLTEHQVTAFLSGVACPTLVVRARDGWPVPEGVVQRRLQAIGDQTSIAFVDGGHHAHMDNPQDTLAAILPFLSP